MAEQKVVFLAKDGTEHDSEAAADSHDEIVAMRDHIDAFAHYHAEMNGKAGTFAQRFAAVLEEYEVSKKAGVPEVPADIVAKNKARAEERKARRESQKDPKGKRAA